MQNVGNCLSAAADAAAKQKCIDDFAAVDAAAAAMVKCVVANCKADCIQ